MPTHDVVVLGAGPAWENVAGRCADGGLSVALIEAERVGGECSHWGCIPSKTLIRPGAVLASARRVPGAAEAVTGRLDVGAVFGWRDEMVGHRDDSAQLQWLEDHHIELVRGRARLTRERTVHVVGLDGSVRPLTAARAVVIATGTRAATPPIEGLAEVDPWDNRGATAASQVPERLMVLGGGTIGVEMAQAFRRLGCREVTVVESAPRLLMREEPFAAEEVRAAFDAEGIGVVLGTAVTAVRRLAPGHPVVATLADGPPIEAEQILVAAGRRPATDSIGLERVGLDPGRFIDVDDRLRATGVAQGWLYAVGDCNGRALLTHMGKYQGRIAGDVILGRDVSDVASRRAVPRVTFTDPQVAAVGMTEAEAIHAGIDVRVVRYPTGGVSGAATLGHGVEGTSQLVVDGHRGVVVGATFTGPGVQELLHAATIAIVAEVTMERLWHAVPSFPTVSEVWLRLLEAYGL